MMLNLVIICIGKLDQPHWKAAFSEYYKRLQINTKINIITINEINILLAKYSDYQAFLLDLAGKLISSEDLAQIIINNQNFHQGKLLFIIGGSNGFSDEIKNKVLKLAFGRITLLHQLAQVILLEQLYRALQIINNQPYHK